MDAEIVAIANKYLPEEFNKGDNANFQTLAFAAATSSFFRGKFDKTEDYINQKNKGIKLLIKKKAFEV